jgi:hypothetical protein
MNGTSVIIEDIEMPIGNDIQWTFTESPIPTVISKIVLKNIPAGTTIKYTHPMEGPKEWVSVGVASELELPGQTEGEFRSVLDTLTILAAPQSDENFEIVIQVTTDPSIANNMKEFVHPVVVQARADAPVVVASDITIVENLEGGVNSKPLLINVNASIDSERDDSELVSVVITVPSDGEGPYGTLSATSVPGVSFINVGGGVYTINATAATADERETLLDNFLRAGSIKFTPRENFAGDLIGVDGIKVEAISTEQAEGYGDELAPKGVDGDADPKYESECHCCHS